ncbi:hypothetical protein JNW90_13800 [Micromonospora sp. STR1s_5]|nr:hypothetical protein [Micromonospora sp. STR1s_5]
MLSDEYPFQVERWTADGSRIEETIALCRTLPAARGAYEAVCKMDRGRIMMRTGICVLRDRPFVEREPVRRPPA